MNAHDMLFHPERGEVAEADETAAHTARELHLHPKLRQPGPVVLRHMADNDISEQGPPYWRGQQAPYTNFPLADAPHR
jgi:hypothetical protein